MTDETKNSNTEPDVETTAAEAVDDKVDDTADDAEQPNSSTDAPDDDELDTAAEPDESSGSGLASRARRWAPAIVAMLIGLGVGVLFAPGLNGGADNGEGSGSAEHDHAEDDNKVWTCSMHPQIRQGEPGDCPICGMALVPASTVSASSSSEGGPPEDHVFLTERARALAQIRTTEVLPLTDANASRRLLGTVAPNQTRVRTVTAWTNGRIDDLKVATDGEQVRRGQTIATMYSPEIYAAHRDLLAAAEQLEKLAGADGFALRSAERTVDSARQKLRLLGVKPNDLSRMEAADSPWTAIPLRSQFSGTVLSRLVDEGTYVQAGTPIFRIADLSTIWVEFDAYSSDIPYMRVGENVTFKVESIPGTTYAGEITFIDPVVDPRTRTVGVRVEVANEDGELRPGMFVEGTVDEPTVGPGEPIPLVVPAGAVLFSGKRSLVYVEYKTNDGPVYAPRDVEVGARLGDVFPVIAGLERGEKVVSHGAFVIDSDLQIKGGESLMERSTGASRAAEVQTTPAFDKALGAVVTRYLDAQEALADDKLDRAQSGADAWLNDIDKVSESAGSRKLEEAWKGLALVMKGDVSRFTKAKDIGAARAAFKDLTQSLQRVFASFGNPLDESVRLAFCPMAFDNKGAEWFQRSETVDNAYFGSEMLRCGEIRAELEPGGKADPPAEKPPKKPASGASHSGAHP